MELWSDLVTPTELTDYARREQDELARQDSLLSLFPQRTTMSGTVTYTVTETGLTPTAKFRSYDAEASIGGKAQRGRKITLELPPLSHKERIGELDILRSQSNLPDEVQRRSIANSTTDVITSIEDRMELARGQILETGRLIIEENGLYIDEDLGRSDDLTVAATIPWEEPEAKIIDDLMSWGRIYASQPGNSKRPAEMWGSELALSYLQTNLQILGAIDTNANLALASIEQVNAVLAAHRLPRFRVYDRQVNEGGVIRRVLSEEKIFFVPAEGVGMTTWGVAAEARDPEYGIRPGSEGGIVAAAHKTHDPYGFWVRATGVALPILTAPNASMVAGVLTAD